MAMTTQTKPAFKIPTVDISPYLANPDSSQSKDIITEIRHACKTSGFFQITNHGIPQSLQRIVFESAHKLFDLPLEHKLKLKGADGRGYEIIGSQTLQAGTNPDLKEVCLLSANPTWNTAIDHF
jgi:isopenicillin N synthase-like dioxygenase